MFLIDANRDFAMMSRKGKRIVTVTIYKILSASAADGSL